VPSAKPERQNGGARFSVLSGKYAKLRLTKTKTALKQETYNLSDLKHDLHCGFVELGDSEVLGVVRSHTVVTNLITTGTGSNNPKSPERET
jgi:hypothetical protein